MDLFSNNLSSIIFINSKACYTNTYSIVHACCDYNNIGVRDFIIYDGDNLSLYNSSFINNCNNTGRIYNISSLTKIFDDDMFLLRSRQKIGFLFAILAEYVCTISSRLYNAGILLLRSYIISMLSLFIYLVNRINDDKKNNRNINILNKIVSVIASDAKRRGGKYNIKLDDIKCITPLKLIKEQMLIRNRKRIMKAL